MSINGKQSELTGIDRLLAGLSLSDHIRRSFTDRGLKSLSIEIDSDPAELSRFQSGQGGLTLPKIERILEQEGLVVVRRSEVKRILSSWMTATEMLHRSLWDESNES